MPITNLHVSNFKGISEHVDLALRPLNFFIGANSSGKSSCIHALAALSQSVKIPNNSNPLLLDDEYAYIHLGRFIEVIHSKSYADAICLGISIDKFRTLQFDEKQKLREGTASGSAVYSLKCTRRTQDIFLDAAHFVSGDQTFDVVLNKSGYKMIANETKFAAPVKLENRFIFSDLALFARTNNNEVPLLPVQFVQQAVQTELRKVAYLGPFRQPPSRRYQARSSTPQEVGPTGEATMALLANEMIQSQSRKHIAEIQSWLRYLGLGNRIDVSRIAKSDMFDLSVSLDDGKTFPLADLGFGVSQVLPVLTQCSFARQGAVLLFEQPEIHLHTIAARKLLKVFTDTVRSKNARIIAETHSPDIIHQIQQELRAGNLKSEEVVVYRVTRSKGASQITELKIEDDFSIYENWEKGLTTE